LQSYKNIGKTIKIIYCNSKEKLGKYFIRKPQTMRFLCFLRNERKMRELKQGIQILTLTVSKKLLKCDI